MAGGSIISLRVRSVLPLAFFFAYVLAFVFEGPAFYSMMGYYQVDPIGLVMTAVAGEFIGLLSGGFLVKSALGAKRMMLAGMVVCLAFTSVFFFPPTWLWFVAMVVCAVVSGWVNSAWGYCLKAFTPSGQRIKTCADVLIYSNMLMIAVNMTTIYVSPFAGLGFALALIAIALVCTATLPVSEEVSNAKADGPARAKPAISLAAPMATLVVFVTVITVNSGLMYQMIVPSFAHLTELASWYWAVPYIIALYVMRNLPAKAKRSNALYLGMGMIMASFVFFMALDRSAGSYLVVDTLMLGACGIFDLFWWSILAEMMDGDDRPARIFGIGLSANVFGILVGNLLALVMDALMLPTSSVTIVALSVVCITLMLLPPLNQRLSMLLKNHAYLTVFSAIPTEQQREHVIEVPLYEPLTPREQDVLMLVLNGKSNKAIAKELSVSENTVKTHVRNIYAKYQAGSRAELISMLLRTPLD